MNMEYISFIVCIKFLAFNLEHSKNYLTSGNYCYKINGNCIVLSRKGGGTGPMKPWQQPYNGIVPNPAGDNPER
ncbi:hypothetical protein BG05_601 [Bacillus mycoides]|nr:hypothetical protein BG05_601 [Bacillus mycoides]